MPHRSYKNELFKISISFNYVYKYLNHNTINIRSYTPLMLVGNNNKIDLNAI